MDKQINFKLQQEDIIKFQEDGALFLKGVFSSEWIDKLTRGIETNLANPSIYSEKLKAPGGPGYYFNDYCNWQNIQEFGDFVYNSNIGQLAGQLMESECAVFYHEHVLTKDAATYKKTPWHQDQPYYPIDGEKNCSIWIPVDSVDISSTIQFAKGSHKWGKWYHPQKFETSNKYVVEKTGCSQQVYYDIPNIDNLDSVEILKWACEPGDCVVFHMLTVHGAPENLMTSPRRVISLRWLGDDAVIGKRPWEVSPPILAGLSVGDRVVSDTFPTVWKKIN